MAILVHVFDGAVVVAPPSALSQHALHVEDQVLVAVAGRVVLHQDVPSVHIVDLVVATSELMHKVKAKVLQLVAKKLGGRLFKPCEVEHVEDAELVDEVFELAPERSLCVEHFDLVVDKACDWSQGDKKVDLLAEVVGVNRGAKKHLSRTL